MSSNERSSRGHRTRYSFNADTTSTSNRPSAPTTLYDYDTHPTVMSPSALPPRSRNRTPPMNQTSKQVRRSSLRTVVTPPSSPPISSSMKRINARRLAGLSVPGALATSPTLHTEASSSPAAPSTPSRISRSSSARNLRHTAPDPKRRHAHTNSASAIGDEWIEAGAERSAAWKGKQPIRGALHLKYAGGPRWERKAPDLGFRSDPVAPIRTGRRGSAPDSVVNRRQSTDMSGLGQSSTSPILDYKGPNRQLRSTDIVHDQDLLAGSSNLRRESRPGRSRRRPVSVPGSSSSSDEPCSAEEMSEVLFDEKTRELLQKYAPRRPRSSRSISRGRRSSVKSETELYGVNSESELLRVIRKRDSSEIVRSEWEDMEGEPLRRSVLMRFDSDSEDSVDLFEWDRFCWITIDEPQTTAPGPKVSREFVPCGKRKRISRDPVSLPVVTWHRILTSDVCCLLELEPRHHKNKQRRTGGKLPCNLLERYSFIGHDNFFSFPWDYKEPKINYKVPELKAEESENAAQAPAAPKQRSTKLPITEEATTKPADTEDSTTDSKRLTPTTTKMQSPRPPASPQPSEDDLDDLVTMYTQPRSPFVIPSSPPSNESTTLFSLLSSVPSSTSHPPRPQRPLPARRKRPTPIGTQYIFKSGRREVHQRTVSPPISSSPPPMPTVIAATTPSQTPIPPEESSPASAPLPTPTPAPRPLNTLSKIKSVISPEPEADSAASMLRLSAIRTTIDSAPRPIGGDGDAVRRRRRAKEGKRDKEKESEVTPVRYFMPYRPSGVSGPSLASMAAPETAAATATTATTEKATETTETDTAVEQQRPRKQPPAVFCVAFAVFWTAVMLLAVLLFFQFCRGWFGYGKFEGEWGSWAGPVVWALEAVGKFGYKAHQKFDQVILWGMGHGRVRDADHTRVWERERPWEQVSARERVRRMA